MAISQAGFLSFIRQQMAIDAENLPDGSPSIPFCLALALAVVNPVIARISGSPGPVCPPGLPRVSLYEVAVYNLAADYLINYTTDVEDGDFFSEARAKYKIGNFTPGVVQSTSDEGTSSSLVVQKMAEEFSLGDLQNLKTPYGRQYLTIAQSVGIDWGIS